MRKVARRATLCLHHKVLIHKRPCRLAMALRADRIHLCRRTEILAIERAVRIVAIRALHQPFLYLVVERHIELRLRFRMALQAEFRLLSLQQLLACLAVMNAVAADAAHVVLAMRCTLEICMLPLMAAQTTRVDLLR